MSAHGPALREQCRTAISITRNTYGYDKMKINYLAEEFLCPGQGNKRKSQLGGSRDMHAHPSGDTTEYIIQTSVIDAALLAKQSVHFFC